jgi:hypothetical protein
MPFAEKIATDLHHKVLVILDYPSETFGQSVSEIASFKRAIAEDYHLYVVQPVQNSSDGSR